MGAIRKYLENHIRGWLPKEPSLPRGLRVKRANISQKGIQRKIFKISSAANAIILGTFLGLHSLIDPFNKNIDFIVISWIIFILSIVSVNLLLYRYSKKKTNNQREGLKS